MSRNPVPALAQLGIVFQQPTLDLELSVTANLLFHAGLHGIPRATAQARIADELARLGLTERANDKAAQLSGGNRRRVELARALLHEPARPADGRGDGGLDPASRSDLLKLLLTMRTERSVAVLWATHLCDEVPDADRVIVLHRGKVLAGLPLRRSSCFKSRRRDHRGGVFEDDRDGQPPLDSRPTKHSGLGGQGRALAWGGIPPAAPLQSLTLIRIYRCAGLGLRGLAVGPGIGFDVCCATSSGSSSARALLRIALHDLVAP